MNLITKCKPRLYIAGSLLCAALPQTGVRALAASLRDSDEGRVVSKKITDGVHAELPDDADGERPPCHYSSFYRRRTPRMPR